MMKGAAYGMTLAVILLVVNLMLYLYGVDLNLGWLDVGLSERQNTTMQVPSGEEVGGLTSTQGINQMITVLFGAIILAGSAGILANFFLGGDQTVNWMIPVAMIGMFVVFFLSPMGNIITATATETTTDIGAGTVCYTMRSDTMRFNKTADSGLDTCLPWTAHIILVIFFGLLMIGLVMTFIGGREW